MHYNLGEEFHFVQLIPNALNLMCMISGQNNWKLKICLNAYAFILLRSSKKPRYSARWTRREVFNEIILDSRVIADHTPLVVQSALDSLLDVDTTPLLETVN